MKVNKRIGKFKQWTGEKLGGQQKTELSEDFQSLEQDVELRKAGVERMYSVSKEFSKHLTRKVEPEGTDTGKVLPIDALGLVLANHGDEFGHESSFGQALMSFGRAQQQIATSTANFSDHLNSGWLSSLEKSIAQMAEYTNQRKKLDSRRLTYDAMLAKVQKSKKEKRELEDDLRVAKNRYEETSEEVQERAVAIQDAEADQMVALTKLLELESTWIDEQKRIIDDLKKNWPDPSILKSGAGGRKKITAHTFGAEASSPSKPMIKSKSGSVTRQSRIRSEEDEDEDDYQTHDHQQADQEYEFEERGYDLSPRRQPRPAVTAPVQARPPPSRRGSLVKEKGSSISNSNGRYGGVRIPGMPPVGGGGGGGSVHSEEPSSPTEQQQARSRLNSSTLKHESSSSNLRRSGGKPTKWMRAKWAYNATESDELELDVGDRIKVTNEINSEWFVGRNESSGRSGMFPAAYCTLDDPEPPPPTTTKYLIPDSSDTFADPDDHYADEKEMESYEPTDESEGAGLRLNASMSSGYRPVSSSMPPPQRAGSYPGKPAPPTTTTTVHHPSSSIGKRAPPPPPSRRSTTASAKPVSQSHPPPRPPASSGSQQDDDQPEAFGSVSELKKRLGMFK